MRWLAMLSLLLLPVAQAGGIDDPEIADPDDDGHAVEGKDVVKAWIEPEVLEDGAPALWFRIETAGDFEHVPALFALHERYRVAFKVDGAGADEWYLALSPSRSSTSAVVTTVPNGPESVTCRIASAPAGKAAPLAQEVAITSTFDAANRFGCIVPYAALGLEPGQAITDLYVEHVLVARGPLSGNPPTGGDNIPYTVIETFDRAPDSGFGRPYQTASLAPAVTYVDAAFPVNLQQGFTNATSAAYQVNWTSPAGNLAGVVDMNGTGSVNITVTVGNQTIHDAAFNGTGMHKFTLLEMPAGNGTILVNYTGFTGTFSFQIDAAQAPDGGDHNEDTHDDHADDQADGNAAGNETVDGGAKDTPLPFVAPAVGLLAAATVRRRR